VNGIPFQECAFLELSFNYLLFSEEDEEFHNLIRKHMVMPFVIGDFFPGHSEEVAGGKYSQSHLG